MIAPSYIRIAAKLANLESHCFEITLNLFDLTHVTLVMSRCYGLEADSDPNKLDSLDSLFLWHALPSPELSRSWRGPQ